MRYKYCERGSHDFLSGLNQNGSDHYGSKARGIYTHHGVQLLAIILYESIVVLMFLGENAEGIPSIFI